MAAPSVDPFRLHERAATPAAEHRAVVARMRAYYSDQGNAQYLRKLIYEDSATIAALIPLIEAATSDQDIIRGVYNAAAVCGGVGECGGNIGMWPIVLAAADQLDTALDTLEGSMPPDPPIPTPPAATAPPQITQEGATLSCSTGTWTGEPTLYGYVWRRDDIELGVGEATWTITAEDEGHVFDAVVTATNEAGSAASVSAPHTAVAP